MEQVIFGGCYVLLDSAATEYNSLVGGIGWHATESKMYKVVSTDGIIKNLRVILNDAPGAGKHYTFSLMVNGAPSALTFDIADAATSGNNMVNEIDVAPGDYISLQCDPDNSPTARLATWTSMFEGDTIKESLIMGGADDVLNKTATDYGFVMGAGIFYTNVENDYRQVVPTAGTIKDFYVKLSLAPGWDAMAYTFTVRLNGATVAQSLIVSIVAGATTGSDLVHNLAVVAGDVLTMMIVPTDTPDATPTAHWGMTFVADTDGESVVLGGCSDDLHNTTTEYNTPHGDYGAWNQWEELNGIYNQGQACTVKKLYILLSAAPGGGNTYTFTIRLAFADSNVVAAVTGLATTGNSAALEDTVALDEYVDLQCDPDSTPNVADAYWGFVGYLAPPAPPTGLENKSANMASKMIGAGLI